MNVFLVNQISTNSLNDLAANIVSLLIIQSDLERLRAEILIVLIEAMEAIAN